MRIIFWFILFCGFISYSFAETVPVHMDIVVEWGWGGSETLRWQGQIRVENGIFVNVENYEMDPMDRGLYGITSKQIMVDSLTRGGSDGAKFRINGSLDSIVVLDIEHKTFKFILKELLRGQKKFSVGEQGAKIIVKREAHDRLRLLPQKDDLVLVPKEKIPLSIISNPINEDGRAHEVEVTLSIPGTSFHRSFKEITNPGSPPTWEIDIEAPIREGIYDLVAEGSGCGLEGAQARIQFIVIDSGVAPNHPRILNRRLVDHIDCSKSENPKKYFGDDDTIVKMLPLGKFRATSTKGHSAGSSTNKHKHMGWFAYRLHVENPERPHFLEVTYPDDAQRTVGVSIVEKNAAGKLTYPGLDSGFNTGGDCCCTGKIGVHSIVFWPKTNEPIVLITNRLNGRRAAIGEIKLYEVIEGLPTLEVRAPSNGSQRLLGIYYEEPNVVSNFGGVGVKEGGQSLSDWNTFYQAGRNLVDYLKYTGLNSVLMQSYGYETSLFPTEFIVRDFYRYDKGIFFSDGRDPFKKDILELYLRLFERNGLFLIPSINFEQMLPALEKLRSNANQTISEIDMVRFDGTVPSRARRGLAPWYDPVHPEVQRAILDVVVEVARRYKSFKSFPGISLQHRGLAFIQYRGLDYGYGDYSVNLFQEETGIKMPVNSKKSDRFMARHKWIVQNAKEQWIAWRCNKLHSLMLKIRDALQNERDDLKLFVSYMNTFRSIGVSDNVLDWIEGDKDMHELFRVKGLDPYIYMKDKDVIVTRPVRTAPISRYLVKDPKRGYLLKDLEYLDEVDKLYSTGSCTGVLVFHEYYESRLRDFDAEVGYPGNTWLVNTITPSGRNSLKLYASFMADLDPVAIFFGGWQAPMGCPKEMREFAAEFRPLPKIPFLRVKTDNVSVVCRTAYHGDSLYFYVVNRSEDMLPISLQLDRSEDILSLGSGQIVGKGSVKITLNPFAFRSFRTSAEAKITSINQPAVKIKTINPPSGLRICAY